MEMQELSCPSCGGPITWDSRQRAVQCKFCQHWLDTQRTLCAACNTLNLEGERFCSQCGSPIMRTCPACKHDNWAGAEHCTNCGRTLDLLEIMTQSSLRDTRSRIECQQREASLIKQREAAESEARMQRFHAKEQARQKELARRQGIEARRERVVLGAIVLGTGFFILLLIIISVWLWMN